ncbi:MAG: hypothetical protein IJC16_10855 [Rikenellaceae bacterium]|nr:hypothetical protein [Rikenellaceae bacterium]
MYRLILPLLLAAAMAAPREAPAQINKAPGIDQLWMQHLEGCWKLALPPEATSETDPPGEAFCCKITKKRGKRPRARLGVVGPGGWKYYKAKVRKGNLTLKGTGHTGKVSYLFRLSIDPSQVRCPGSGAPAARHVFDILNFTPGKVTLRPIPIGEGDAPRPVLMYVRQNEIPIP